MYGLGQVDHILGLKAGTSERWIDGYQRAGRPTRPDPAEHTGDEIVTWGEFIEARLLAQYRDGALVAKMRPAVEKLREELNTLYPLASAESVARRRGARARPQSSGDRWPRPTPPVVVVRNEQQMLDWSPRAQELATRSTGGRTAAVARRRSGR